MNFPNKNSLTLHIIIVLTIKFIGLFVLWWFFVRGNQEEISTEKVASHYQESKIVLSKDDR